MNRRAFALLLLTVLGGCSRVAGSRPQRVSPFAVVDTTVHLHGKPLTLHLSVPAAPVPNGPIVIYASGDGGWFGAAPDMFRRIGQAGYPVVGFSSRAFLRIERPASRGHRRWPFETFGRIARLGQLPCAVIQATHDSYMPGAEARRLFGPDTPVRRFYEVDARNHRFSGGKAAFDTALLDALRWIASPSAQSFDGSVP